MRVDKGRFIRRISVAPNAIQTIANETAYLVVLIKHKTIEAPQIVNIRFDKYYMSSSVE